MADQLNGTTALVTGASSGIGEATARMLAEQGATVALVARRKERLDQLAQDITRAGGRALVVETDVAENVRAQYAVERTVSELGRLDILVNDAGVGFLGPIESAPIDEWDQMVRVNLMGALYTTHAAIPHLIKAAKDSPRQVADLVNVSSVAGRRHYSGGGVYEATKFGLGAFSESLRREITRRHVRVALVEPGAVATEIASHEREEVREQVMQQFSGFETLDAKDIADAIRYIVTRPRRVAVNELLILPTEEEY
ncbi:MAG TPA: SDR family NAD(P)-dependent oxidoreductase [Ktedonobacterales bacterium]|nr:SDR family NAD(P)-dependent oxidoreductase [Ktedonobacterales bacterium]